MADASRPETRALELYEELRNKPYRYGFFEALRQLECVHRDKPRIGESSRAADDPVRLAQEPSLAFAPSTLKSFDPGRGGFPPRLAVYFFGLLGPNGALPLHLTEYARDRLRNSSDPTLVRFLDLFHHRMLALHYRSWASSRPVVSFDRPEEDPFARYVGSLFGLGMPTLRQRDEVPDLAKLHYAGRFAAATRSPDGLEGILSDFFEAPVRVEEFVGEWLDIPTETRVRLGGAMPTPALGAVGLVGERVWQCHHRFRIVLGPVAKDIYQSLLPGTEGLRRLEALVKNYVGEELDWELELVLEAPDVAQCQLGDGAQLGFNSWLNTGESSENAEGVRIRPLASVA